MIVLGLGSNCGDRLRFLRKAIQNLKSRQISPQVDVLAISPLYESDALLPPGAPQDWNQSFLNLAVLCRTTLSPVELLQHIKQIEGSMGRKQRERWAPREIDIDILKMHALVFSSDQLQIPHPSLEDRPFALLPLDDLVPEWGLSRPEWRNAPEEEIPFRTHRSTFFLTELIGILNITPDSFSDGGLDLNSQMTFQRALKMISQGVRILDLGAESTRPQAIPVTPETEWMRLEPVLESLQSVSSPIRISIDTRHPEVASQSIKKGIHWINDVTGLENPEMQRVAADSEVDWVIMHSITIPPQKNRTLPLTENPTSTLLSWAEQRIHGLVRSGISRERMIFDPGIGFGKTREQSWQILREIRKFQDLGVRILVGHSRKSLFSSVTDRPFHERDFDTSMLSAHLAANGVDYLRVHHPEMNESSLKLWTQIDGISRCKD